MDDAHSAALHRLADAVGLSRTWKDVHGRERTVSDQTLEALLDAMGLECGNGARLECSVRQLQEEALQLEGRMVVAGQGEPIVFAHDGPGRYRLEYESGEGGREGDAEPWGRGTVRLAPVEATGYHHLRINGRNLLLAVAPRRCAAVPAQGEPPWGIAVQVYSLRRELSAFNGLAVGNALGAGDYGALAELAREAGRQKASALAISPVHALFSADPQRYSPYAPSSRLFLNTAYLDVLALGQDALRAALAGMPEAVSATGVQQPDSLEDRVDWAEVQPARLAIARQLFQHFDAHGSPQAKQSFEAFRHAGGEALQRHCLYETLHEHYAKTLGPGCGWQDWPAPMRDPNAAAVQALARQFGPELRFHAFMQWLADAGMRDAQKAARQAGMPVGLIADLAIGTDARGSQAWSAPQDILRGATVGAAPDLYHPQGQEWGLTAFSPRALHEKGFRPFLAILRHALSHAGGVRIDHVLGLARMWLVPQGASAAEGAFLRYPLEDMLRLVALESQRHQAIVVGENLGTVPPGFNELLSGKGVLGTSVLWFEREQRPPQRFISNRHWPNDAMATTTTHDLPTVAGWWQGRDLDWGQRLGQLDSEALDSARAQRAQDRHLLAQALPAHPDPDGQPPLRDILEWVAASPAPLCVFPLEDLLALPDQPNMPGSPPGGAHPNWLRRLPWDAASLFATEQAAQGIGAIRHGRRRP